MAAILAGWAVSLLYARADAERIDQHFDEVAGQLVSSLGDRLATYEHGLRGARGAIIASGPQLSRERFAAYSRSREYGREFPGVGGYGYIQRVPMLEMEEFQERARQDGAPDFSLRQLSPHEGERFVILYLEPAQGNRSALGLDIASEPNRRASALEAARSGRAVLSHPITLVQREEGVRHGFLLLLPVYRENADLSTSDARWQATFGWVFAPLSIEAILGTLDAANQPYALSLADRDEEAATHPFYTSHDFGALGSAGLSRKYPLDVHGRRWLLEVRARPSIAANLSLTPPWLVGGLVAVLGAMGALLWYVWALARERRRHSQLEGARLAAMVQGSVDAIIACDTQGRVTHWNAAAERMLGRTASSALGRNLEHLLIDAAGDGVRHDAQEADGRRMKLRGADAQLLDFMVLASPFSAADGRIAGTCLLLHDMADRIRAEEHFRLVVEASPNAILMVDQAGIIHLANAKSEELFGYPRSELLGHSITKLLPVGARGGHDAFIAHYFKNSEARAMGAGRDLYCLRSDGIRVPVEIGLNPLPTADGLYALASIIDITERKRQEERIIRLNATLEQQVMERTEQIRTYSSRLTAILQHAGYAIVATDIDGTITLFNPAAERMLGYSADELIGRRGIECLHDDGDLRAKSAELSAADDQRVEPAFTRIASHLEQHAVEIPEWKYLRKGGGSLPVRLSISVLRDDRQEAIGYLVMASDLTEQKARDSELRKAIGEAEQANRYKSDFLANMSHEIRTPMNAIMGMLYLMDRTDLPSAAQDMTRKIRLAAQSLLSIINDVLDFSKIEAGRIELEDEPFDLADVMESVAALMASAVDAKGVEMLISPAPPAARYVRGDALRLGQVLINLVSNAIKFTQQGEVVLDVEQLAGATDGGVRLRFSVTDTGIGISEEKQRMIFSPFSQVDSSTTRKYGGTGLGLSICSRLVKLMGGTLALESQPGKGSRFSFVIPLALDPKAESKASKDRYRVLVVDDHDIAREHLGLLVRGFGWTADVADSGERAMQRLDRQGAMQYDIVLMDWQMPGMDGLATAAMIRSRIPSPRQPIIIMVTGFERKLIEQDPCRDDVDAVLTKPITASALYNVINEVLRRRVGGAALPDMVSVEQRLGGYRLLVVDDSDINREVAQRILEGEGARVELAVDGRHALEMLQAQPDRFDVVLMDVQMPEMDGYEATARIRKSPELADMPVVALTAGAFKRQQDAALQAGMNAFVAKPFEVSNLVATILQFASRHPQASFGEKPPPVCAADPVLEDIDPQLLDIKKGLSYWREAAPYRRYLAQFARRYAGMADALEAFMRRGDRDGACAEMHKMRGAASSLALPSLVAAAAEAEELLRDGKDIDDLMGGLRLVLRETLEDIHQYADPEPIAETVSASEGEDSIVLLGELLKALDSDDPESIDAAAARLSGRIRFDTAGKIFQYIEEFDFRGAEDFISGLIRDAASNSVKGNQGEG
ncbi:CHASE domain-containing hybrid sensor histidine kinase/response regulator [Pseudoxanthomonas sacheonensis]|uniref:CHASE domain-containing hybrid sensor histidine kinase/response regulator n=1 Tax=Pseudoxanthomonas sacheonensis TaxID=443615 RepID=UPI0013D48814|nr:PAS domain S-box protein [Pseudoxanthomonas sacheonensis]